jgi:hypothetical protein
VWFKQGDGLRRAIGGLLACPICTGTWSALALVALHMLNHNIGTVAIVVLGMAGVSEFIYYAKERNSWDARLARVHDGRLEGRRFTYGELADDELSELFGRTPERSFDVER